MQNYWINLKSVYDIKNILISIKLIKEQNNFFLPFIGCQSLKWCLQFIILKH